jgi:hypothetical protein
MAGLSHRLRLTTAAEPDRVVFRGGKSNYESYDSTGYHDTGIALAYGGLKVAFTLTGADTYELRINDGAALSGTLGGTSGTPLSGLVFFNYNAGPDGSRDSFFNSIEVYHP